METNFDTGADLAVNAAETLRAVSVPLSEHRQSVEALHADAELQHAIRDALAGNVTTSKSSTIGVGVVKFVISRQDQTYRAREALLMSPDDEALEGAIWVEVRGNTTLRHLVSKYGRDLLAYDAARTQMSFEIFAFEVFETNTRSVRILVRQTRH